MRIEINSSGIGALAFENYQSDMSSFVNDISEVIDSFAIVKNRILEVSGGVGQLDNALTEIENRISQETTKLFDAEELQKKSTGFYELAIRVDKDVATSVKQNNDRFYSLNPNLKPTIGDKIGYYWDSAIEWLCGAGQSIYSMFSKNHFTKLIADTGINLWSWTKDKAQSALSFVKDTAVKAWNGIVEFYLENKKIIDTIVIVIGAVVAIAGVVLSGGLALVPLLGGVFGLSTATAISISSAVAVTAVVSTVGSSVCQILSIWCDELRGNTMFKTISSVLNITSLVSNVAYNIGNIYNSFKRVSPQEYINAHPDPKFMPNQPLFDDMPISPDNLNGERFFVKGDHYDDFVDFWEHPESYQYANIDSPSLELIDSSNIEGVYLSDWEVNNSASFWNKRYSKIEYMEYLKGGNGSFQPIEVSKINNFFVFNGDGRHRILAAKELGIKIPVVVKYIYTKIV